MSPLETTRQLLALIESLTARELQTACFDALRRLGIQEDNPKIHPRDLGPPLIASVTALKDAGAAPGRGRSEAGPIGSRPIRSRLLRPDDGAIRRWGTAQGPTWGALPPGL